MKRGVYIILSLCIMTIGSFSLTTCAPAGRDDQAISLAGKWKMAGHDNRVMARPEYDDSGAGEITIPGNWNNILEKDGDLAGTIWLRKKFFIGKNFRENMLILSLGPVAVADETYFNGVFIGGKGEMPSEKNPLKYGFAWQSQRNYYVPASIVRWGKENVISIRVFSHVINGIRDDPVLASYKNWKQYEIRKEYIPAIINITPILTIFFLLIFFIIIFNSNIKPALIILAMTLVLTVSVINILLLGIPQMANGLTRLKIMLGFYVFADFIFLLLVQEFFSIRYRWMTLVCLFLLLVTEAAFLFVPDSARMVKYCGPLAMLALVLYIFYAIMIVVIALIRDPRQYWYFAIIGIIITISAFNNIYSVATYQLYKISYSSLYHVPIILLGGMFVYIFDLKNAQKERDSLTTMLLRRTQKLNQLMKRVEHENVKPEPRESIVNLIEYLDNNYSETYDRITLAKKFNLNEDYMGQVFKKKTGTNISAYINNKRIEVSKQLLRETQSKIIDIAYHVGFDNLTYFYRLFKKQTGLAPNEYRNRLQGKIFKDEASILDDEIY
jgi:AraC-like DNA-binding protein